MLNCNIFKYYNLEDIGSDPILVNENGRFPFRHTFIMFSIINFIIRLTITRDIIHSNLLVLFILKRVLKNKKRLQKIKNFLERYGKNL